MATQASPTPQGAGGFWGSRLGQRLGGSWLGAAGHVGGTLWLFSDIYRGEREAGRGKVFSAVSAGVQSYWWSSLGILPMVAFGARDFLGEYIPQSAMETLGTTRVAMRPFGQQTYNYTDTQNRATMRARSVNLIQQSRMGLRQVLGNEAAIYGQRYG